MDANTRRHSRLDIERLRMAADRLETLSDAYALALDDLRIARQGLKIIATWAVVSYKKTIPTVKFQHIHDRAIDTLSLMYHKE